MTAPGRSRTSWHKVFLNIKQMRSSVVAVVGRPVLNLLPVTGGEPIRNHILKGIAVRLPQLTDSAVLGP